MQDSYLSKFKIESFIKSNGINIKDFVVPADGFKSFNDFFIRKIKPDVRQIDYDENCVISPADCKVFVIQRLEEETEFFVKNNYFNLEKFLNDKDLAREYLGGTLILFRLRPKDYHRFHFPFDCIPTKAKAINGTLETVNPIAYKAGINPLTENERKLIFLKSEKFDDVAFVPVGAMMVGKISETYKPNKEYLKGDEAGYFSFGGSSIVMIFKKNIVEVEHSFVANSEAGLESEVLIGQRIANKI